MSIHLDPKWHDELQRLVDAGHFDSVEAAVNEAVGVFLDRDAKLDALRALMQEAETEGGEIDIAEIEADLQQMFGRPGRA